MINYEDMPAQELLELAKERIKSLIEFDLDYARKLMPGLTDDVLILGMHKARYICEAIPAELRHSSAKFLRDGGHTINGCEILPEGDLP